MKKKSEIVRDAGDHAKKHYDRICYCTPNRQMMLGIQRAVLNEGIPNPDQVVAEMAASVEEKLQRATGYNAPLRVFDENDTSPAYALTNRIVDEAFEETAVAYEKQEMDEWLAAEAAWEESVRASAPPPVRHQAAPELDPAQQRTKAPEAKAKKTKVTPGE